MKVKFKESNEEHIVFNTGDTLTATNDEGTWVWIVIEDTRNNEYGCFALNVLSAPDYDDVGKYTTDGRSYGDPNDAESSVGKLIVNLRNSGFKNIRKANFTLVEE